MWLGGASFTAFVGQSIRLYELRVWDDISLSPLTLRSFSAIGNEDHLLHLWKMDALHNGNTIIDIKTENGAPLNTFGVTNEDSIFTTKTLMNLFQYSSFPVIEKFQRNSSFALV